MKRKAGAGIYVSSAVILMSCAKLQSPRVTIVLCHQGEDINNRAREPDFGVVRFEDGECEADGGVRGGGGAANCGYGGAGSFGG